MPDSCINNQIQTYIEHLREKLQRHYIKDNEVQILYEMYKEIRVEMASKGFLVLSKQTHTNRHKFQPEKLMSNPKVIACGIFYIWTVLTEQNYTQNDISKVLGISIVSVSQGYRVVKQYLDKINFNYYPEEIEFQTTLL